MDLGDGVYDPDGTRLASMRVWRLAAEKAGESTELGIELGAFHETTRYSDPLFRDPIAATSTGLQAAVVLDVF